MVKIYRSVIGLASTRRTPSHSVRTSSPDAPSENCVSTNISTLPTARGCSHWAQRIRHARGRVEGHVDFAAPLGQAAHRFLEQHAAGVEEPDVRGEPLDLASSCEEIRMVVSVACCSRPSTNSSRTRVSRPAQGFVEHQ